MDRLRKHHASFKNAVSGLIWAFTTQRNFDIHVVLALLAIGAGIYLQISATEFSILILAIVFGLGVEMANTAIEELTNLVTTQWRKEAKIAKDVSAGMMLLVALGTLLLACIILLPKIWVKFF